MMNLETKKCRRCKGEGYGSWIVMGGICYGCGGKGYNYIDKFTAEFGPKPGRFFGFTEAHEYGAFKGMCDKVIRSEASLKANKIDIAEAMSCNWNGIKEITEDQARAFFSKYGTQTRVQGAAK